jgi:hypothetical protein
VLSDSIELRTGLFCVAEKWALEMSTRKSRLALRNGKVRKGLEQRERNLIDAKASESKQIAQIAL